MPNLVQTDPCSYGKDLRFLTKSAITYLG